MALPYSVQAGTPELRAHVDARIFPAWAIPDGESAHGQGQQATAATWIVSSCADAGPGTLRDTLAAAGAGDTLDLRTLTCNVIALQSGVLVIKANDIHLLGPGAGQFAIDGGGADRVLIDANALLTVTGLTVRNGANRTTGFNVAGGGCIAAAGEIRLIDSVVTGCIAAGEGAYGGALYAYQLTAQGSTISANTAYGYLPGTGTAANGGAAFVYKLDLSASTISGNAARHFPDAPRTHYDVGGGMMVVRGGRVDSSTFMDNRSGDRGGAINSLGTLSVTNSTFAGNVCSGGRGGALYMRGQAHLALTNATISGNHAAEGGGIHLGTGGADVASSIVHGNAALAVAGSDNLSASVPLTVTGSHSLVGGGHAGISLPADTLAGDPGLGPLQDNGGPTLTMALSVGSPAVDAGSNPLDLPFDQRGADHPRVLGAGVDIGAFEGARVASAAVAVPTLSWRMLSWLCLLLALVPLWPRRKRGKPFQRRA